MGFCSKYPLKLDFNQEKSCGTCKFKYVVGLLSCKNCVGYSNWVNDKIMNNDEDFDPEGDEILS